MSRNYGLPYKGSKNKIAEDIVRILPPAHTLYDLFCGGCAITDCAMESGKFKHFVINDIDPRLPEFFRDALAGKFKSERRVIDRATFNMFKGTDPYVASCWSFGSNCDDYVWAEEIEDVKLAASFMVMAKTYRERRLFYRHFVEVFVNKLVSLIKEPDFDKEQIISKFEQLQSIDRLERLESLEAVDRLSFLDLHVGDYSNIPIANDSVIYCDIPYKDTSGYSGGGGLFNYERFYEWAGNQNQPVFISEYWMPDDLFECIWEKEKTCTYCATKAVVSYERIFIPKGQKERGLTDGKQLALELV